MDKFQNTYTSKDLKIQLESIKESDNSDDINQKLQSVWPKFKQTYEQNTSSVINNYKSIIESNKILNINKETLVSDNTKVKQLNDEISTKQRESEISLNNQRIIDSKNHLVKVVLIIGMGLTALPIMRMFGLIDKKLNFTILASIIVLLSIYIGYTIYVKDLNRDSSFFNEFNFLNPNENQLKTETETSLEIPIETETETESQLVTLLGDGPNNNDDKNLVPLIGKISGYDIKNGEETIDGRVLPHSSQQGLYILFSIDNNFIKMVGIDKRGLDFDKYLGRSINMTPEDKPCISATYYNSNKISDLWDSATNKNLPYQASDFYFDIE